MMRWYLGGIAAAVVIAWIAALCHSHGLAPAAITSIVVGVVLGATLSHLAAMGHRTEGVVYIAGTRKLVVGAILLGLLTVLAQHAWLYREFRRQWHASRATSPQVAMFRAEEPLPPSEYFAREATPQRIVLWIVDAASIIGVATCIVLVTRPSSIRPTPDP